MAALEATHAVLFSDYYKSLEASVQARYRQKISKCENIDPYVLKKKDFSYEMKDLPCVPKSIYRTTWWRKHHSTQGNSLKTTRVWRRTTSLLVDESMIWE